MRKLIALGVLAFIAQQVFLKNINLVQYFPYFNSIEKADVKKVLPATQSFVDITRKIKP